MKMSLLEAIEEPQVSKDSLKRCMDGCGGFSPHSGISRCLSFELLDRFVERRSDALPLCSLLERDAISAGFYNFFIFTISFYGTTSVYII